MIFDILGKSLHHQINLGPPDGSLDFSQHQGLLVKWPPAKTHFEKMNPARPQLGISFFPKKHCKGVACESFHVHSTTVLRKVPSVRICGYGVGFC